MTKIELRIWFEIFGDSDQSLTVVEIDFIV